MDSFWKLLSTGEIRVALVYRLVRLLRFSRAVNQLLNSMKTLRIYSFVFGRVWMEHQVLLVKEEPGELP